MAAWRLKSSLRSIAIRNRNGLMKKHIVSFVATALVATTSLSQAAAPPGTNVVQPVSITLEFVSQVSYTNATGGVQDSINTDVLRTNKTAKTTNITETTTTTYRSVTNKIVNKDIVAAINPSLAGGTLVRVTTPTVIEGNTYYVPEFQIRLGTNIYVVPSGGNPSISFGAGSIFGFVNVGKVVIVTNTTYSGSNVTSVATTNGGTSALILGSFTLQTPTLSCTVSGPAVETGSLVGVGGTKVHVQNVTAKSVAGSGSDAIGNSEMVYGSIVVSGGKVEN